MIITFIFDRCCHSLAAVAPVKYKCDSNNLISTLKILLTEKLMNGGLVTPTPGHGCNKPCQCLDLAEMDIGGLTVKYLHLVLLCKLQILSREWDNGMDSVLLSFTVMYGNIWPQAKVALYEWFIPNTAVIWRGRDHFAYAPSQLEMTLQCNIVSHWLGAYTKWSLDRTSLLWECEPQNNKQDTVLGWGLLSQFCSVPLFS